MRLRLFPTVWLVLLGAVLLVFPFMHNWPVFENYITPFRTFNATMFAVWLLIVLSMNLLTGYSGQISLGHAGVMLIGAYICGILSDQYSVPMPLAIALAAVFTGLVGGIVIGIPAVRLTGPYLAIATFALVISLPQILKIDKLTQWTNGAQGIRIDELQPPGFIGNFLDQSEWVYYVTMATAIFMAILFWNLTHSRVGRAFTALRDSEIGAEQMGVNVPFYKALAFGLSSFYAGLAGGLYFMVQGFVGTDSLGFFESLLFLIAVVIGGLGTILGSVFGALFLTFNVEAIDKLSEIFSQAANLRGVIYGAALVITILLFPKGVAGFVYGLRAQGLGGAWRGLQRRLRSLDALVDRISGQDQGPKPPGGSTP